MKKTLFSILAFFALSTAFAQFEQGRMLVGGDVGFSSITAKGKSGSTTVTYGKTTTFSLSPKFGYFIIDNLAIGGELEAAVSNYKDDDGEDESKFSQISIGPFARYYFDPGVFVHAGFGFGSAKEKDTFGSGTDETKYGLTKFDVGVGYAVFLNDNVAIEPMLGYGTSSLKNKDNDSKSIDSGIYLSVGFQIYLSK